MVLDDLQTSSMNVDGLIYTLSFDRRGIVLLQRPCLQGIESHCRVVWNVKFTVKEDRSGWVALTMSRCVSARMEKDVFKLPYDSALGQKTQLQVSGETIKDCVRAEQKMFHLVRWEVIASTCFQWKISVLGSLSSLPSEMLLSDSRHQMWQNSCSAEWSCVVYHAVIDGLLCFRCRREHVLSFNAERWEETHVRDLLCPR